MLFILTEKEVISESVKIDYDKKKSMSKAFGTIAISFIVVIYATLILIDINWRFFYEMFVKLLKKIFYY